jgi:dCMP deaminase
MNFQNYIPPSFDEWFMREVYHVSTKSKDPSTKVGAVLIRDNHTISSGYNGFPIGVDDNENRYSNRSIKYFFAVHAEDNCFLTAARFGISTINTILYTTGIPCNECAKSIIQGGVKEVVIHKQWPEMTHSKWIESTDFTKVMFRESGISIRVFDKVLGITSILDGKIINV